MRRFLGLAALFVGGCLAVPGGSSERSTTSSLRGGPRQTACAVFENAVCVCDDLAQAGAMHVKGGVGVDGHFTAATSSTIDGDLAIWRGLALAGRLEVGRDLVTTGNVAGAGALDVGGDLVAAGNVTVAGTLRVGGARRYDPPKYMPCGCDDRDLLDVAAAVSRASTTAAHLDAASLSTLSEGRWYVRGDLDSVGLAHLVVDGHASLYVDGSITSVGERRIELRPGATLDLYVSGSVTTAGEIILGDPNRPSAFRLFVGGTNDVMVAAGLQELTGLLYAPHARVSFAGETVVHGAIFAKSITYAGELRVDFAAPERGTCVGEPEIDGGSTAVDSGGEGGNGADASGHDAGSCL